MFRTTSRRKKSLQFRCTLLLAGGGGGGFASLHSVLLHVYIYELRGGGGFFIYIFIRQIDRIRQALHGEYMYVDSVLDLMS
jgi:hypothetical protein